MGRFRKHFPQRKQTILSTRTDNLQSFCPISNKIQDLRFATYLNLFISINHCHYRAHLGEERDQLRPNIFSAAFQNKRSDHRTMVGFYIPHCIKLRSRQASHAKQQTLRCFLFKQSVRLATACDARTTIYVSKAIGLR